MSACALTYHVVLCVRYKYLWADGARVKDPIDVPAPEYINLMFACVGFILL